MNEKDKLWISTRELAQMLGYSETTLAEWRRSGTGPVARKCSNRRYRYLLADVHAWIETIKTQEREPA